VYRWIVFLSSKTDSKVGVLNRYYGIFEDGRLKVRGIDLRRHDTPEIVRQCQTEMLDILTKARDSNEFRLLIPSALKVLERFVGSLRDGTVPLEDLVIVKNLSKNPDEYTHEVPQAIAARHLVAQGGSVHAGQQVSYILTSDRTRTALPPEVVGEDTVYDSERYVDLLCSSAANLLLPLGYDAKYLRSMFKGSQMKQAPVPQDHSIAATPPEIAHYQP
jgi:DNA polymerase-2